MGAATLQREVKTIYNAEKASDKVRVNSDDPTLLEIDYFRCDLYHPWGNCPEGMTWEIRNEQGYFGLVYQVAEAVHAYSSN